MKKRLLTSLIILIVTALFVASRYYTTYAMDAFIGILAVVGCVEVTKVLERKRMFTNVVLVGCFPAIMYIAMTIGIINKRDWLNYIVYFVAILLILFLVNFLFTYLCTSVTHKEKDRFGVYDSDAKYAFNKSMNSAFVMIYPAILFVCMLFINHYFDFAFVETTIQNSNLLVLFFVVLLFAITMITDSMALVVGTTLKGPKLCPTISPNKTISGAIGGFVFGTIGGVLVYYLFSLNININEVFMAIDLTWWKVLIVSMIASVVGQIGDIVASKLKRSARVKDYGTIFPGHGGVMDRVDGLIFNALVILISMFVLI